MASALDKQSKLPVRASVSGMRPAVPGTVAALDMPFQHGEVIGGKYKIIRLIGTGGVGFVVSARHVGFDEVVALKFLRPEFATHAEAVSRFTIEARASFKIKSEHVARVIDVDSLPDGTPFIAMELLEGTDLRSLLDRCRVLPIELAVDYTLQTCEALAAAHAQHIIHRDIKPENLFLSGPVERREHGDQGDQIKVLDFGISKVALTGPRRQTQQALTRVAVGTPPYMSPEQVRASSDLDARADIWSVGCVLYELLTGTAPFDRMSLMQSCAAVLEEEPVPPRDLRLPIPVELDAVVMRCLQKDPQQRYQDVAELAEALEPFASEALRGYPLRCRNLLSCESTGRRPTMNGSGSTGLSTVLAVSKPANIAIAEGRLDAAALPIVDLPTTRPTLLLSDALAPPARTQLWPLSLGLGAALAFCGAYALSHSGATQPAKPIAAQPWQVQPKSPGQAPQKLNAGLQAAASLPLPAAAVVPQPVAASAELPAPPTAEAVTGTEPVVPQTGATVRKAKPKLRGPVLRKANNARYASDEPDVGF